MLTRISHLKIKLKSLAAESKIIRSEEKKHYDTTKAGAWTGARSSLYLHRIGIVRSTARVALLAYGFLRGIDYAKLERNTKVAPPWAEVREHVQRFGVKRQPDESAEMFKARKNGELAHFDMWSAATVG